MKKFYVSPAIEVTAFVAEDILCASTVSFENDNINYGVVGGNSVAVDAQGVQTINEDTYTYFGN